jgi:lipopolysaccharide export system permease protein
MIKRIDRYIMGKFLATFFVAITLILALTIVFDVSEKLDGFIGRPGFKPSMKEILLDYYLNFIPFFGNLFSPLFVFISVIFFTSRMASRLEIISILATGISYWRLLIPFLASATLIACISWTLTNYVLPHSNEVRIKFEKKYFGRASETSPNFHRQLSKGEFVFVERYDVRANRASKFSYEKIENDNLVLKIMAGHIVYDSITGGWQLHDYIIRSFDGLNEKVRRGQLMDTSFAFTPAFFKHDLKKMEMMSNRELNDYIAEERAKGSEFINHYLIEKHNRNANPFSTIILTLLGVPIASRKVRGGIGFHLAMGVAMAFTYIFLMRVTTTFALNGIMSPWLAVWLPNFLFAGVGLVLTRFAQK